MSQDSDDLGTGMFRDNTGHTIKDYPSQVGQGYLLGIDESGAWYFDPTARTVENYQLEEIGGNDPELALEFSMDPDEVDDTFEHMADLAAGLVDKTVFGHALIMARRLEEESHLSEPQAKVYAFREVYNVGRNQTAKILDKSVNTIDNQLLNANQKAEEAKGFVRVLKDYAPSNR